LKNTTNDLRDMIGAETLSIDEKLHSLVIGVNILDAVNPTNFQQQKERFFASNFSIEPAFAYAKHGVNAFAVKRDLFNLPVDKIKDQDLQYIYEQVIDSYIDKIDQFKNIGSGEFLYDSLRYYGEPTDKDIRNAMFILHLPDHGPVEDANMDAQAIKTYLAEFAHQEGYEHNVVVTEGMVANALVSGLKVKINQQAKLDLTEVKALAHHELGVHLLTTLNARAQPLKIMSLGLPMNTLTQEGLAILCEYLAGCLSVKRLKRLALRVIAVDSMIRDRSFKRTFSLLREHYQANADEAFTICARVYRGGGYTKDYVYLQGLHRMLSAYEREPNFNHLLVGKTSIDYLPETTRLIEKGILLPPQKLSPALVKPEAIEPVQAFIAHAIK